MWDNFLKTDQFSSLFSKNHLSRKMDTHMSLITIVFTSSSLGLVDKEMICCGWFFWIACMQCLQKINTLCARSYIYTCVWLFLSKYYNHSRQNLACAYIYPRVLSNSWHIVDWWNFLYFLFITASPLLTSNVCNNISYKKWLSSSSLYPSDHQTSSNTGIR